MNVSDPFRHMVTQMFTQLVQDYEYTQTLYDKGVIKHGDKAASAMLKEYVLMGEGDKNIYSTVFSQSDQKTKKVSA